MSENNEPEKIETIDETVNGLDETTAEALEEIRAEDNIEAEATPAEATTDDTKSFDNSKYKNIITELEIIRDSVKNY